MKVYIVIHDMMYESEVIGVFKNKQDAELTQIDASKSMQCIKLEEWEVIE